MLTRRAFTASIAFAALSRTGMAWANEAVTFWGPPAAPSIVLAQAVSQGLLSPVVPDASFKIWKTPDEMRAGISSGSMKAVILPTYAAANLYNKGLDVRLVNVMTDGLLHVVAPAGMIGGVEDLRGRKIAVPFRNDMPDFVLRRVLSAWNIGQHDITLEYSGTPPEAAQLLLFGKVDAALLVEPAASAVIAMADLAGKKIEKCIDIRKAWAKVGGSEKMPQAGLALSGKFIEQIGPGGMAAIQSGLDQALTKVLADPVAAASTISSALGFAQTLVSSTVMDSNLVVTRATEARLDLETMFKVLEEEEPRIIGGKLPDDGFYAL